MTEEDIGKYRIIKDGGWYAVEKGAYIIEGRPDRGMYWSFQESALTFLGAKLALWRIKRRPQKKVVWSE